MLADKDRIFTNLYGMFDRSLDGARARGQWDDTAGLIGRGREKMAKFGFDHAAVGSALGSAWHFPATLVDCMAFHHAPADADQDFRELVAIVHIANGCAALFDAPAIEAPPSIEPATWAAAGIDATVVPEILERARERVESMQAALL